jgi:hypothetical protein
VFLAVGGIALLAIAPLLMIGAAAFVSGDLIGGYFRQLYRVLRRVPRYQAIPPYRPGTTENGTEMAYRQYFYGQATRDLRQAIEGSRERALDRVPEHAENLTASTWSESEHRLLTWSLAGGILAGVGVGAVVGGLAEVALAAAHVCVVSLIQGLARLGAMTLRAADTLLLRARGIRGMQCPWCYEKNTYPAYRCECRQLHHDIRPGRYGVFRRRCGSCERRMPTLILLGSYRMNAYCVHPNCGRQMSDETGRFREVVLPMIGGTAAGKTRLMGAMLVTLHEAAVQPTDNGAQLSLRFANAEAEKEYQVLKEVLDQRLPTSRTPPALPRAHSYLLRTRRRGRLIHQFDASGELFLSGLTTAHLRYLASARTFIFVLDPMSAPRVTDAEKSRVDHLLISRDDPWTVYSRWTQEVLKMNPRLLRRSRLAVAISKTDLSASTSLFDGYVNNAQWTRRWGADCPGIANPGEATGQESRAIKYADEDELARAWLTERLGLGNLVQGMNHEFHEVRFFFTAAVNVAPGRAHASIHSLVAWALGVPVRPSRP